jgi:CubicO group peptidase (beta-lactamase class C family)
MLRLAASLVLGLLLLTPRLASAADAAGRWEGSIDIPGSALGVAVTLQKGADGAWAGTIDIPQQGAKALPLRSVAVGETVTFAIDGVPGDPTFTGTLAKDGATIAGAFTQGPLNVPFHLARKTAPEAATVSALGDVDPQLEALRSTWKVPGMAVAVVRGGKVVYAEGFGHRDVEKTLPVTADTTFAIGSSTKAFTTAALATLVDEGKIAWDDPVVDVVPEFRLSDEEITRRITLRDLVSHRSGWPRHDMVWYAADLTRDELVRRLRYLDKSADLREKFQYNNLMFVAAGWIGGRVAGTSWEDLVTSRILRPLGMTSATLSVKEMQSGADCALAYREKDDVVSVIPCRDITLAGPAGSINASVADMAKWALFHLGDGTAGGRRILSREQMTELHRPAMVVDEFPTSMGDPEIRQLAYALGWLTCSYRGELVMEHGGNIDGYSAEVWLVPEKDLGIVVLTNLDGSPLPTVIARTLTDRVLGLEGIDWSARAMGRRNMARAASKAGEKAAKTLDRRAGTSPSHPLAEYAGDYEHPAYGAFTVRQAADGTLAATFHGIPMKLEHWHFDTFRLAIEDPALAGEDLFAHFTTDLHGEIDGLRAQLEQTVPEIEFAKRAPSRLSEPAFLAGLLGDYAMDANPAMVASVALRGERAITVTVPGQPTYDLLPLRGTEYALKGLTGFSLRFMIDDATGSATEVQFVQPDGVYLARRK